MGTFRVFVLSTQLDTMLLGDLASASGLDIEVLGEKSLRSMPHNDGYALSDAVRDEIIATFKSQHFDGVLVGNNAGHGHKRVALIPKDLIPRTVVLSSVELCDQDPEYAKYGVTHFGTREHFHRVVRIFREFSRQTPAPTPAST